MGNPSAVKARRSSAFSMPSISSSVNGPAAERAKGGGGGADVLRAERVAGRVFRTYKKDALLFAGGWSSLTVCDSNLAKDLWLKQNC